MIKIIWDEAQKACTQDMMTCVAFVLKQKKKSSKSTSQDSTILSLFGFEQQH